MKTILVEIKDKSFPSYLDNHKYIIFRDENTVILKGLDFLYKKKKGKNKRHIIFEDSNVACTTSQGRYFAKRSYTQYNIHKKISDKTFDRIITVFVDKENYNNFRFTRALFVNNRLVHIELSNMCFYLILQIRLPKDKNIDELNYCFSELEKVERNLFYLAEKL